VVTPTEKEIEAVWDACGVQRTGSDMSNECRLAARILTLLTERAGGSRHVIGKAVETWEHEEASVDGGDGKFPVFVRRDARGMVSAIKVEFGSEESE